MGICGSKEKRSNTQLSDPARPPRQSSGLSKSSQHRYGGKDTAKVSKENISRVLKSESTTGFNYSKERPTVEPSIELQTLRPQPGRMQDPDDPDFIETMAPSAPALTGTAQRKGRQSSTPPTMSPAEASERRINPGRQPRRQGTDATAPTSTGSSVPKEWQMDTAAGVDKSSYKASSAQTKPPPKTQASGGRYHPVPKEGTFPFNQQRGGQSYPPLTAPAIPASGVATSFGHGTLSDEPLSYDQGPTIAVTASSAPGSGSSGKAVAARYKRGYDAKQEREENRRNQDASDPARVAERLAAATLTPRRSATDPLRRQATSTEQSSVSTDSRRTGAGGHFALDYEDDEEDDTSRRSRRG